MHVLHLGAILSNLANISCFKAKFSTTASTNKSQLPATDASRSTEYLIREVVWLTKSFWAYKEGMNQTVTIETGCTN